MSQEKPRKRDRLRTFFGFERPKSPGGRTASPHSRATSRSLTHISRPDLPSTSVPGGAVAPKETTTRDPLPSTQLFTPPILEPSVETETGGTILDPTLNSSPTQRQLHQQPKHRLRPRNDQADSAASHNVISSENTEKLQNYQDGAKHNEFIKPVFHGGQTFNYGAYVSLGPTR